MSSISETAERVNRTAAAAETPPFCYEKQYSTEIRSQSEFHRLFGNCAQYFPAYGHQPRS